MKAKCGLDYIRGGDWQPLEKSLKYWKVWARKEAAKEMIELIETEWEEL